MNTASTFNCFGLVIHGYDLNYILTEIATRSSQGLSTWIVTANPEILLKAKKDPAYWEVLRQADLRIVDGQGLQFAGMYKGAKPKRVAGVDLAEALSKLSLEKHWTVALLGGLSNESTDKAAWYLRRKYSNLSVFAENGGRVSDEGTLDEKAEASLTHLVEIEPDVVLVSLGFPKQDHWITRYRNRLPKTKVFIGVGGTVDFWAGDAKRAPKWIQSIGFEWFWRLLTQPWRWKRIWNALVIFPLTVVFDRS
ncbi:MAG: WecB/TagA/CpsF family glycosyltransferase [Patescibacteria group bacterium]|jgi:N-acetylglucosaminyldiphosphoundecaprenol N-acetyl-beta-D-mannosaminyltransferase